MRRYDIYYKKSKYKPALKDNMDKLTDRLSKYGIAYPDKETSIAFKQRMKKFGNADLVQTSPYPQDNNKRIITLRYPYQVKKINSARIRIEKQKQP